MLKFKSTWLNNACVGSLPAESAEASSISVVDSIEIIFLLILHNMHAYCMDITMITTTDTTCNTMKNILVSISKLMQCHALTPVKVLSSCVRAKILFQPKCFIRLRNAGGSSELEGMFRKNLLYLLRSRRPALPEKYDICVYIYIYIYIYIYYNMYPHC